MVKLQTERSKQILDSIERYFNFGKRLNELHNEIVYLLRDKNSIKQVMSLNISIEDIIENIKNKLEFICNEVNITTVREIFDLPV